MVAQSRIVNLDTSLMLKELLQKRRVTHAVLARRMKRSQPTIKGLLERRSIQTYILWELSVALKHNFFTDLAAQLNAATDGALTRQHSETEQRMEQLQKENAQLKAERDYLRKALDLIEK